MTFIYALLDPRNNECKYVGKTINIRKRMTAHITGHHNTYKSKWINCLKPLQPEIIVLEETDGDWVEAEQFWIAHLRGLGAKLTNLSGGGEGTTGYRASADTVEKLRQSHLGIRPSDTARANMSAANTRPFLGKTHSDATRRLISQKLTGRKMPQQMVEGQRVRMTGEGNYFFGRSHSEETKAKIREKVCGEKSVWFGKKHTPETIEKLCAAQKGHTVSEECREKLRAANLGKRYSEETKKKLSEMRMGHLTSDETKEKIRGKNRARWDSLTPEQQKQEIADRWVARKAKQAQKIKMCSV